MDTKHKVTRRQFIGQAAAVKVDAWDLEPS